MSSVSTKLVHKSIETDNLFSLTTGMVLELSTQAKEDLLLYQVINLVNKRYNIEWLVQASQESKQIIWMARRYVVARYFKTMPAALYPHLCQDVHMVIENAQGLTATRSVLRDLIHVLSLTCILLGRMTPNPKGTNMLLLPKATRSGFPGPLTQCQ